jgi:hypothetical protein
MIKYSNRALNVEFSEDSARPDLSSVEVRLLRMHAIPPPIDWVGEVQL